MKKTNFYGLLMLCAFPLQDLVAQVAKAPIQLNQVGFYPAAAKIAVVTVPATASQFTVQTADKEVTVFKGSLSAPMPSSNSSLVTRIADFTAFTKQGKYVVVVEGVGKSYPFRIGPGVHRQTGIDVLKGFYFQRSNVALTTTFAGEWQRPAGHPDTAVLVHPSAASPGRIAGTVISTPGGWYDAGDYNKYIVNSGITMGTLLAAYENFPAYFKKLNTGIPESSNALPDILDEIIYNLRWMITMQDPFDGGVYHKCTNAVFDGMVMPHVTKDARYVVQKGTAATLDFAAVLAQSSRLLKPFERQLPGLSDSCRQAAIRAWQWAGKNKAVIYNQDAFNKKDSPAITTGGYGDRNFDDEFFWAASELLVTTGDTQYLALTASLINQPHRIPSWNNVQLLGLYSLFSNKKRLPAALLPVLNKAQNTFILFADSLAAAVDRSAFQTVMGKSTRDFNWGSNSNAANQGIALLNAFQLTKKQQYLQHALGNLDYILGRNATGYCFVTGVGTRSPMHPHHRPSVADGVAAPVPGLLAGGPNPGKQDKCAYEFHEPETTYADVDCSYASNEIAINWNAPLVYLANALEALQATAGNK